MGTDPGQRVNLASDMAKLEALRARLPRPSFDLDFRRRRPVDAELERQLRALGYMR